MDNFYEIKFQINRDQEAEIASKFGLKFVEQYSDLDIYIKTKGKDAFKLKLSDEGTIFYHVKLSDGIFRITGKIVDEAEKRELLVKHPVEIEMNRINRVYAWRDEMVYCDFDYIKQFPDRVFFKIYAISRESVEKVKIYLADQGFSKTIDLAYNKLYSKENRAQIFKA